MGASACHGWAPKRDVSPSGAERLAKRPSSGRVDTQPARQAAPEEPAARHGASAPRAQRALEPLEHRACALRPGAPRPRAVLEPWRGAPGPWNTAAARAARAAPPRKGPAYWLYCYRSLVISLWLESNRFIGLDSGARAAPRKGPSVAWNRFQCSSPLEGGGGVGYLRLCPCASTIPESPLGK